MDIKQLIRKKSNTAEHGQELRSTRKPWLSAFVLALTLLIGGAFLTFSDNLLLGDYNTSQSVSDATPNITTNVTVNVTRGTAKGGGNNYTFTHDSGYTLFLLSFQEKEIIDSSCNLETTANHSSTKWLSGYTVTKAFKDLEYVENLTWKNSLGKIYAEYGTLGLTGTDTDNKHTLIKDIIATDFPETAGLDVITDIELLNGLAYRSNVLTIDLINRSIIYVPKDAATFDLTLKSGVSDYKLTANKVENYIPYIAPWMQALLAKQMAVYVNPSIRTGTALGHMLSSDNVYALVSDMRTAFLSTNDYSEKLQAATHLQNAIAFAWPVLVTNEASNQLSPLFVMSGTDTMNLGYINPAVNMGASDANKHWRTPFVSRNYVVEDTLHKYSCDSTDYNKVIAALLDDSEELKVFKKGALDEDTVFEALSKYYKSNPEMAYAVLDTVFGNIREDTITVPKRTDFVKQNNLNAHKYGSNPTAVTTHINFEKKLTDWLGTSIDTFGDKDDETVKTRVAGLRQAQLHAALAYIIEERCGNIKIDPKSNIEIRLLNIYSNIGFLAGDIVENRSNTDAITELGWQAWDTIFGLPGQSYCASYDTLASIMYSWDVMSTNKYKVATLANASLGYANKNEFGIPMDNDELIAGHARADDIVVASLSSYDTVRVGYCYGCTGVANALLLDYGVSTLYGGQLITGLNNGKLALTCPGRQAYLCTLYARAKASTGIYDNMYNTTGILNLGITRDTAACNTSYTGIIFNLVGLRSNHSIGVTIPAAAYDNAKYAGMSKYRLSKNIDVANAASEHVSTLKYKFNTTVESFSRSKLCLDTDTFMPRTANTFETAAGSFIIRTNSHAHTVGYAMPSGDGSTYIVDTEFSRHGRQLSTKIAESLNDNQVVETYVFDANLAFHNLTANNLLQMAFNTYTPKSKQTSALHEDKTDLINNAANNTVASYGYFAYLYNHTYYEKNDEVEIHAVMGFREKGNTDLEITHECAPGEIYNHDMVLGINLSKAALETLSKSLDEQETKVAELTVSLGGINGGKFGYWNVDKTMVLTSKFDTSVLATDGVDLLNKRDFGQLKKLNGSWTAEDLKPFITTQKYDLWMNRKRELYKEQLIHTNSSTDKGFQVKITITKEQVDKWLEDDKYASDATFHKSDTEFMLVAKTWPADFFAGEKGNRIATLDSDEKFAINTDYTLGVECQLVIVEYAEDSDPQIERAVVYDDTKLKTSNVYYATIGTGLYSGLYGSIATKEGDNSTIVLALKDDDKMPEEIHGTAEYCLKNTEYGEGTDNHVYFKFSSPEIKQWQFTGKASLYWDGAEDPKLVSAKWTQGASAPILGYNIASTMTINYEGGETTIKEFYDTLVAEGVKYIVVSIGENSELTEDSYQPNPKNSKSGALLKGRLDKLSPGSSGMKEALQKFNSGSMVYTLDEFVALMGGLEGDVTTSNIQIKNEYTNTATAGFTGNDPDNILDTTEAGAREFDANRLEFSFLASVYGLGETEELKNAVKTDERDPGFYLNGVYADSDIPCFDLTSGLGYILNPKSADALADDKRYQLAMAKELANLAMEHPDRTFLPEDTELYTMLTEFDDLVVWTHETSKAGSGVQIEDTGSLEGHGLRHKPTALVTSLGDDKRPGGDAWVAATCSTETITPTPTPPPVYVLRTSSPIAYTAVKNGTWTNGAQSIQEWNTLTGIPSTETFFITSGGSEFIIEMSMIDLVEEQAYRSYISHFAQNDCKFKPGDISSAGGGSTTSVNKADISHELNVTSSVGTITDYFNLPEPTGYTTANFRVSQHGNNTITAYWTGTIANTTSNPGMTNHVAYIDNIAASGDYDLGHPGQMTETGQELEAGSYSWNVTPYNTALQQARDWAKLMEDYSDGAGNVIITSNSDQKTRTWHVGDAVITIKMDNVDNFPGINEKDVMTWHGDWHDGTTNTTDYVDWKLETNDRRLTSGWAEKHGEHKVICEACKGGLTDSINGGCYNVTSKPGHWANYESDLANYNCASHKNTKEVKVSGKYTISCTAPSGTSPGSCSATWAWDAPTKVDYLIHWCGHDESSPLKDASGNSFTPCTYKKVVDQEAVEDNPETEDVNEAKAEVYHYEVDVAHKEVAASGAVTSIAAHTCNSSHSWVDVDTTTVAAQPLTYHITVTFINSYTDGAQKTSTPGGQYPAHCCCGPCCSHVLPSISDEWVQWISYSTVRITDIRVNKISRSYVEGQNDLTLDFKDDPYLIGHVEQGDVNVFYNIATENDTYKKSVYTDHGGYTNYATESAKGEMVIDGASLAGRIRYNVQAQQHDKVLWREKNQLGEAKRTSECDGQDSTAIKNGKSIGTAKYNPTPDGGQGHAEWWALGILYRRSNSAGDLYYVASAKKENQYNTKFTHANDWLEGNGNGAFNKAVQQVAGDKTGYTNNSLDAKDKATWEYERFVLRRNTKNTVTVMTDTLILQGTQKGDRKILYEKVSSMKTTEEDHKKVQDGLELKTEDIFGPRPETMLTYLYQGQGPDKAVDIPFVIKENVSYPSSIAFGGYNGDGSNEDLYHHSILGTNVKITTALDSDGDADDATCSHPDALAVVQGPLNYKTVVTVDDELNKELFETSAAKLEKRIKRPTASLRIGQLDIQIDPTMQNQLHETEKSTQTWFQIIKYTEPNAKTGNYDYTIGTEYYKANDNIGGYDNFSQESYYYGNTSTGYLPAANKVNDVIVHSPISSHNNHLLKDDDFTDQRTNDDNLTTENETKICPGTSMLCEYAYLDCGYLETKTLFHLNFDRQFNRVDKSGMVTTSNAYTYDSYGYITSVVDIENLNVVSIKTGSANYVEDGNGSGLTIIGASLNIPLKSIDAAYTTGTKIRLDIQGSFSLNTKVFECGEVNAIMRSNYMEVNNGTKAQYRFYFNNATGFHNYELTIDFDGLNGFALKVDGNNITRTNGNPVPDSLSSQFTDKSWDNNMKLGERCTLYDVKVVHLPGTTYCTDGCYEDDFRCQLTTNYTCDVATKFTGSSLPHKYTAQIEGQYLIELYDGAGNYQSQKIYLEKGESIYAYLGNKGYWSYSGTDRGYTSNANKVYISQEKGEKAITPLATPQSVLDKTSGSGEVTLTPGIYYIETMGKGKGVGGYLAVTTSGKYYYSVGNSSWINTANNSSNALAFSGTNIPGTPHTSHTHTASCGNTVQTGSGNIRTTPASGYTALAAHVYYAGGHCQCGNGYSIYAYYGSSYGASDYGSILDRSGSCYNNCSTGTSIPAYGHTTTTIYAKTVVACNNLPLNTGGTAATVVNGYVASNVTNANTSLTGDTPYVKIYRCADFSSETNISKVTYKASTTIISPLETPQVVLDKTSGSGSVDLAPGIYYIEAAGQAGSASKGGAASGWLLVKSSGKYYYSVDGTTWFNSTNSNTNAFALAGKGGVAEIPAEQYIEYSGSAKTITLKPGTYIIEAWGAQGGDTIPANGTINARYGPGKFGGYTKGTYTVTENTSLYIVVGGKGGSTDADIDDDSSLQYNGGYNGGGSGSGSAGAGGGGATHIQIGTTGTVIGKNFTYPYTTSMSNLLMIANGGGAGIYEFSGTGSYMNGLNGDTGYYTSSTYYEDNGGGGAGYRGGVDGNGEDAFWGADGTSWVDTSKLANTSILTRQREGNGLVKITTPGGGTAAVPAVNSYTNALTYNQAQNNVSDSQSLRITKYVDLSGIAADSIPSDIIGQMMSDGTSGSTSETVIGEYNYTGGIQSVVLTPGEYLLEVWGAQGGSWSNQTQTVSRGLGGYSKGTAKFNTTTTVYIVCGGAGADGTSTTPGTGGYNGGGGASATNGTAGGGGATHIATATGVLSSLSSNRDAVLIVAGGAGGLEHSSGGYGGAGGGLTGGAGYQNTNTGTQGQGGTQTSGYAFGQGGSTTSAHAAGGGGGWYGGYAYSTLTSVANQSNINGGGGSGYIGGVTDGETTSGVNAGHGKAKITRIGATIQSVTFNTVTDVVIETLVETRVPISFNSYTYESNTSDIILSNVGGDPIVFEYTGNVQAVTLEPGTYRLEAWGAAGGGSGAGQGGYTAGTVTFDKKTTLYIYVGEKGNGAPHGQYGKATFNGGGQGWRQVEVGDHNGTSGGGATDIRLVENVWYDTESLKSRILVAGGGGGVGCASAHNPGHGGGLAGATTVNSNPNYTYYNASAGGGTQTAPGTGVGRWAAAYGPGTGGFGFGAPGEQCAAGGGGGYYGGGTEYTAGGGGGSSYVSGFAGCDTTYLANQKLDGKNLTFSDVVMQQGGNSGNGRVRITKVGVATSAKYQTAASDGYTWVKVFSHDTTGGFFTSANEALHTGTPTAKKYSILDEVNRLRTSSESKYVFKLYYPETGQTNIWKQTNTPQDEFVPDGNGTRKVTGYEAISIGMAGNYWGGLAKSTTSGHTFIDGSINHGNWYYAIGSYAQWGTGPITIPGGDNTSITKVELWVATDIEKVEALAGASLASGDHILNSTVTSTTGCPVESPYYWFILAPKTNVAQIRLIHEVHTADCPREQNTMNSHTHTKACIGGTPAWDNILYAALHNTGKLNELCQKYLGVPSSALGTQVYNTLANKTFDLTSIPKTVDGHDNPILNCYNHNSEHEHTITCRTSNRTSICNNVHHQGDHYGQGHPLCYEPCNDNEKHNPTKVEVDGTSLYIGTACNLNGYFTVYWDNIGDFYDTGDKASLKPSSEKGQGYENGMDTTRWLKRKVIIFNDIDVLFYDETIDDWKLYKAGTEIELPIVTDGVVNGDDDVKRNWRDKDTTDGIENLVVADKPLQTITSYAFYCLLNNNEYDKTCFQAWTEGLNADSSKDQGNRPYDKLRPRSSDATAVDTNFFRNNGNARVPFSALHSTRQYHLFDVIGQIGNLIVTYTTDPRWSNFFKKADTSGWQMENILYNIYEDEQERYLYLGRETAGQIKDIRNHKVTRTNLWFDTWNTEAWKHEAAPIGSILEPQLLANQTNYVWSKLAEELKCGYDIYCEITTTGNYNRLSATYKYYVMNKDTKEVTEVDLWSKVDSSYLAYYLADDNAENILDIIGKDSAEGYYGIQSKNSLALYYLYNNLAIEKNLRMVTQDQINLTNTLSRELDKHMIYESEPYIDESGEVAERLVAKEVPGEGINESLQEIGTAYGVSVDYRSRVLVGDSYDNWGLRDYSDGITRYSYPRAIFDTNLGKVINQNEFTSQARRWLFTAGLAENTVAVKYIENPALPKHHVDLTAQSTHEYVIEDYDTYAVMIGVDIVAYGDVWNLYYEAFESPQRVLNKTLSTAYPDIIAVYGLSSKEDDFDVEQTH